MSTQAMFPKGDPEAEKSAAKKVAGNVISDLHYHYTMIKLYFN